MLIDSSKLTPKHGFIPGVVIEYSLEGLGNRLSRFYHADHEYIYFDNGVVKIQLMSVTEIRVLTGPYSIWNEAPDDAISVTIASHGLIVWHSTFVCSTFDQERPFWATPKGSYLNDPITNHNPKMRTISSTDVFRIDLLNLVKDFKQEWRYITMDEDGEWIIWTHEPHPGNIVFDDQWVYGSKDKEADHQTLNSIFDIGRYPNEWNSSMIDRHDPYYEIFTLILQYVRAKRFEKTTYFYQTSKGDWIHSDCPNQLLPWKLDHPDGRGFSLIEVPGYVLKNDRTTI